MSAFIAVEDGRRRGFFIVENDIFSIQIGKHAKLVYMYLCRRSDNSSRECYPSLSRVARECEISKTTVVEAIAALEAAGLIERTRRESMERGHEVNHYVVRDVASCTAQRYPHPGRPLDKGAGRPPNHPCPPGDHPGRPLDSKGTQVKGTQENKTQESTAEPPKPPASGGLSCGPIFVGNGVNGHSNGHSNGANGNGSKAVVVDEAEEWVLLLNRESGRQFRVKTSAGAARARIKEGFTLADAETVVKHKVEEWRDTEMAQYLRPVTLYGPKFDSYLQAASHAASNGAKRYGAGKTAGNIAAAREAIRYNEERLRREQEL